MGTFDGIQFRELILKNIHPDCSAGLADDSRSFRSDKGEILLSIVLCLAIVYQSLL